MKAVILGAGIGSRLRPLTDEVPKCLIPVAGRPMLDYWIEELIDAGVRDVLINTHHLPGQVRDYIRRTNRREVLRLVEAYEPQLLGSAGTVAANAAFADGADGIILIYADNLSDVSLRRMLAFHRSHHDPITMLLFHAPDPRACGIATLNGEGRIIHFEEKPKEPASDLANAGVYVLSSRAWHEISAMKAFDIGKDVLPRFIGRMRGWWGAAYHLDVGTHEAYRRAQSDAPGLLAARGFDASGRKPAVFLDRDGTLIENVHYLSRAAQVRLLPGAAGAVSRMRAAGFACVLVTNQSAIGRGIITVEELAQIHDEMLRQLFEEGAALDGIYHCPVVPQAGDRTVVEHPDRKPGPGMLHAAAEDLPIDLRASWVVGDMISDVLAARNAGCRGAILLREAGANPAEQAAGIVFEAAGSIADAARIILERAHSSTPAQLDQEPLTGTP